MTPTGTVSNSFVTAKAWSASAIAHWELEEAQDIFLRDEDTEQIVTASNVKYNGVGDIVS